MWKDVFEAFRKECRALGIESIEDYGNPISIVRYKDGTRIGSAHYEKKDMHDRDYTPWITSLYVHPEHRGRGVATSILKEAMHKYAPFYIYCKEKYTHYYVQLQFVIVERRLYLGERVTVLLCPTP